MSSRLNSSKMLGLVAVAVSTLPCLVHASEQDCAVRVRGEMENTVLARGHQGVYFDLSRDLAGLFDLDRETADGLAEMAGALAARNTRLIAVPVPPRALAFREMLDTSDPQQRAFGVDGARASYARLIAQLRSLGFMTADLLGAIEESESARGFFFKRDAMWTPEGARAAADHVARIIKADPVYQALPKGIYCGTRTLTAVDHQSPTSLAIQRSCQQALEPEKTTRYQTSVEGSALDLAGEAGTRKRPLLVIAGSAHTAFAPANFEGFLSELTGLEVINKSGADPSVYGSLISTVTEPGFKEAAPRYLVWEFPAEANLNFLSFVAFRQILPALQESCDAKTTSWREPSRTLVESGSFRVPEDRQPAGGKAILRVATADRNVRTIAVKIRYRNGEAESIRLGSAGPVTARAGLLSAYRRKSPSRSAGSIFPGCPSAPRISSFRFASSEPSRVREMKQHVFDRAKRSPCVCRPSAWALCLRPQSCR